MYTHVSRPIKSVHIWSKILTRI